MPFKLCCSLIAHHIFGLYLEELCADEFQAPNVQSTYILHTESQLNLLGRCGCNYATVIVLSFHHKHSRQDTYAGLQHSDITPQVSVLLFQPVMA